VFNAGCRDCQIVCKVVECAACGVGASDAGVVGGVRITVVIVVGVRVAVMVVGRRDNLSGALRFTVRSGVGCHVVHNGCTRSITVGVVAICGRCVLLVPANVGVCWAAATNQYNSP